MTCSAVLLVFLSGAVMVYFCIPNDITAFTVIFIRFIYTVSFLRGSYFLSARKTSKVVFPDSVYNKERSKQQKDDRNNMWDMQI
jgi:hypothetical protein